MGTALGGAQRYVPRTSLTKKGSRYQRTCQNGPPIQIGHPEPRRTDGNIQRVLRGGDICNAKKTKTNAA